jgi:PTH1 family peptidyl-tRNA hydrolase
MKIVVGLGNPGPKYETTRHNIGFLALDRLVDRWNAGSPQDRNQGEVWTTSVGGEKVLLVKPMTYMNLSGRCVAPIVQFHKVEPSDLIVIYDELDLRPGALRIKTGGGAGGHNGIKSIDESLGAGKTNYHRVRLGIGHPRELGLRIQPADYVLGQFTDDELIEADKLFDRAAEAVELMLKGDVSRAMSLYNRDPESGFQKTERK